MLQLHDALSLLRLSAFWRLTWFVVCVHCVYGVYDQQFPIYFASLFPTRAEGNILYGYLNSIQVLLEAGGLFLAPILVNRIGARQGLILSGLIMTIRILGSGLVEDTLGISAIKLLHAVELPILLVSIFKYIAINFDRRLSATLYLVGFQFSTQLMTSIFSILAGRMYDLIGFAMSYRVMGIIVAIGTLVSVFLLSNKEPQTPLPSKLPC